MSSLRQWIRSKSAPLHDRVDTAYSCFDLSDRHDYGRFLRAHGTALFALEAVLERGGITCLVPDWLERRRSAVLREDLQELEIVPPVPLGLEPRINESWAWGICYVLEGSRLGGRVLSQRVRDGGLSGPLRYLSHGEGSSLWPRFLAQFERRAEVVDQDQLLDGVELAFEQFLRAAEHELHSKAPAQA